MDSLLNEHSKFVVRQYRKVTNDYLSSVTAINNQLYESIKAILSSPHSYEPSKPQEELQAAIQKIIDLVDLTDNLPVFRISSLSDLIDEEKTNLYPFHHLTNAAREQLAELCQIANGMHQATDNYINTTLFELLKSWEK